MSAAVAVPVPAAARYDRLLAIIERHGRKPERLVPILVAVQDEYGWLPREVLAVIATSLGLPAARVHGVATFYAHFHFAPRGRRQLKVCDGTACHVKGAIPLLTALRSALRLAEGRTTTDDLAFTLEKVPCVGACGMAPVVIADQEVLGGLAPAACPALVARLGAT